MSEFHLCHWNPAGRASYQSSGGLVSSCASCSAAHWHCKPDSYLTLQIKAMESDQSNLTDKSNVQNSCVFCTGCNVMCTLWNILMIFDTKMLFLMSKLCRICTFRCHNLTFFYTFNLIVSFIRLEPSLRYIPLTPIPVIVRFPLYFARSVYSFLFF